MVLSCCIGAMMNEISKAVLHSYKRPKGNLHLPKKPNNCFKELFVPPTKPSSSTTIGPIFCCSTCAGSKKISALFGIKISRFDTVLARRVFWEGRRKEGFLQVACHLPFASQDLLFN
ncbi:expressed unknown protein [Seminavis robusta]|uniref:Uncharacterized protein n=1 Tax=Seminavis robusta TaxID=568900 RepID=A0A9N8HFK7_9STRA|nr:expressed unknown protein [Seminavis robusta]|eukprot:Sro354_g124721.1  (117) ;mRNA; r:21953-22303